MAPLLGLAQEMYPKQYNFRSFTPTERKNTALWQQLNSANAQKHPEYGLLPRDAKCTDCVELIDERTEYGRMYVQAAKANHQLFQQSKFPLHYRGINGEWLTIDHRMKPSGSNVYRAGQQPIPTVCDLNKKVSQLELDEFTLTWNNQLAYYQTDGNLHQITAAPTPNYSNYIIGEDGMRAYNLWHQIDMEQFFEPGAIKTNFILLGKPEFAPTAKYLVIEDHVELPEGYTLTPSSDNSRYSGWDLVVRDKASRIVATFSHPACRDANEIGLTGKYHITKSGNVFTIQILVDVNWLNLPTTAYPVVIDPLVTGKTNNGNFSSQAGGQNAALGFTSLVYGRCDHSMLFQMQGGHDILSAYFDVEDRTESNPFCGVPLGTAGHVCLKREVLHWIKSDLCNVTVGPFFCAGVGSGVANNCDTPGVITTDPLQVPGAAKIPLANPAFVGCIPAQCTPYQIPFTLQNSDSSCGDQCLDLCATTRMWQITIEGCTKEGAISANKTTICPGEDVTFTVTPTCGVPPYHFIWDYNNSQIIDTIYGTTTYTIQPQQGGEMNCYLFDACGGVPYQTNAITINVTPAPPANAGADKFLCESGGVVQLGGSPTTSPNANVTWVGENATATGYLSATTIPNPSVTVPSGVIDTFYYTVTAQQPGFNCSRTDTVFVFAKANPVATIDTSGVTEFCAGGSVTLSIQGSFNSYLWSNGATTSSISASQPGQYFVVVTDASGCKDTSNIISVSTISVPDIAVFPDTLIMFGDSVMLYTDINLLGANIDSFTWSPNISISCVDCPNPYVTPLYDQLYGVRVYSKGCIVSDSALIRIILPNNFFIPNVFTPNGDGNNDVFYIFAQSGVRVLEFQVFNRIGEIVHAGAYPWDGNYKGKPSPPGVYVYLFKLGLYGDDQSILRKGSVTIIR